MLSTYTVNKLQDLFYRAQAWAMPANFYIALCTTNCTPSALGTEVSAGNYARFSIARSMANFSGTQGLGTTVVSSGTTGIVYNNNEITIGTPDGAWGAVTSIALMDAPTGGNMLEYYNLSVAKQIVNPGDPVTIPAGQFQSTLTSS